MADSPLKQAIREMADDAGLSEFLAAGMPTKASKKGLAPDVVAYPMVGRTKNGGYLFVWGKKPHEESIGIRVDHPRYAGLELNCLITVYHQIADSAPLLTLLAKTRWQMRSASHTSTQVTGLNRRMDANWDARLQQVHDYLETNLEVGAKMMWLGQGEPVPRVKHLLFPLIEDNQHSVFAAYGGSTKSLLGLACAISLARGESILPNCTVSRKVKTLYVDWEADGAIHDARFRDLLKGHKIDPSTISESVGHIRLTVPLVDAQEIIYDHILEHGFEFVIFDSASRAVGGETIDEGAVISYFNLVASFNIAALTIAHKPKDEKTRGPSGNSQWFHQSRNYWELRKDQIHGDPTVDIAVTHEKSNNNKLERSLGFKITFPPDDMPELGVKYTYQDPATSAVVATTLPPVERLINYLGINPNSQAKDIADSGIGLKQTHILNLLKSGEGKTFYGTGAPGSRGREWSLIQRDRNIAAAQKRGDVVPFDENGWSE